MARLCLAFILLALLGVCHGQGNLFNPSFDYQTLGLQVVLTEWEKDESIKDLVTELQNQIPMNVSAACKSAVHGWVFDMMKKETYALKMADAFGKLPSGLLLGHILVFGDMDECLSVKKLNNVTGQMESAANYCLMRLSHPAMAGKLPALPAYGACLPHACANRHDANAFVTDLFRVMKRAADLEAVQGICITPMQKDVGFHVMFTFVGLIIAAIVAALVVDGIYRRRYRESPNGFLNGTDANDVPVHIYEHTKTVNSNGLAVATHQLDAASRKPKYGYANVPAFLKPLLCFNIMTNLRTILSSGTEGEISFLHGFRVLSVWWIILGNTYFLGSKFFENTITFYGAIKTAGFQLILNSGYAYDSFFLLSGVLITYVLYRDLSKNDGKLNWLLVYLHRWWRLTPVYMFVMLFYVYVLPHGIQSPFKLIIAQEPPAPTDFCKSFWWTNILYINNFFPQLKSKGQCMPWTWLLALDMQLFIIAPLLVILLYKKRAIALALIAVLIAGCIAVTMGLIGYYGLPIHAWQDSAYEVERYSKDVDYIDHKPYTRITPFVVGVALGYLFVSRSADKEQHGSRAWMVGAVGWAVATAVAVPLLFGAHFAGWFEEKPPQLMGVAARVLYGGLQRFGWSLVVGWVLFACQYGYGGPVRRFLGSRFWRPLSNLTYGAYLVHFLTLQLFFASQRHMVYYSTLNMMAFFVAQLFFTYAVALLIAMLVEVPLLRLERLIVRRSL